MENGTKRIAVFIDADNAPAKMIDFIVSELAKFGVVNIRKAYGNWKNPCIKGWEESLFEYAIQPVQQFDLTKGKNATDIAMTIDIMDTLYTKNMDIFCIVSSDGDYTPLVTRILSEGKTVFGFGERKAPTAFVNACSKFLYLEELKQPGSQKEESSHVRATGNELKSDSKLMNLIRNAIDAGQDDDGWAHLASIGSHISNQASFDARNYGYKKLGDLIRAIDLFEVKPLESGQLLVRDKRRVRPPNK
mgnify:CR=1 FL=1